MIILFPTLECSEIIRSFSKVQMKDLAFYLSVWVLWGCGSDRDTIPKSTQDDYGGTPAHLVAEDDKTIIGFARDLPLYYKAIGATMPPDTVESLKTATSSDAVENFYSQLHYSIKALSHAIRRAIHLSDARVGKVAPIPALHSLITAVREFTHSVRANIKLYSWRGSSALRECMTLLRTKSHQKDAFTASYSFNALYRSLSRYFRNRRPNHEDSNSLAISFLEKGPFSAFMGTVDLPREHGIEAVPLERFKNAIAALKDDSPHRDKIYSLIDKYVDLAEKRNHAQTPDENSAITLSMRKLVSANKALIDSVPLS
jgi:hypothetical protein